MQTSLDIYLFGHSDACSAVVWKRSGMNKSQILSSVERQAIVKNIKMYIAILLDYF